MVFVRQAYTQALRLARGTSNAAAILQTVCVRVMLLALNFGTGIIVARSLGPAGRGELAAIALCPTFIATLVTLGIPTALRYHTRRNPENGAQFYAASFLLLLVTGIAAAVSGTLLMPLLLHSYDQSVVRTAQAFMVFTPQVLVGLVMTARFEATGDFRRSIVTQLYQTVVILLCLLTLSVSGRITPTTAALSYVVPCAVQGLWLAFSLWPKSVRLSRIVADGRALLGYGLGSYGTDVVAALASQLDLAVIVMFLSPKVLGLYTVALTLSRLLNIVQLSMVTVIFPQASGMASFDDKIALIARAARLSTAVSAALGAFFLLTVPIILPRLYGEEFRAAIPLMPLLTVEAILGGLGTILNQAFLASGRPIVVTLIEAGSVGSALMLLFVLVPRMDILGAATALLCTAVARTAVVMGAYRVILDRPIPRLFPDASDLAFVSAKLGIGLQPRAKRFQ
jgi:O-antigen/teichoic acid export membrane protein